MMINSMINLIQWQIRTRQTFNLKLKIKEWAKTQLRDYSLVMIKIIKFQMVLKIRTKMSQMILKRFNKATIIYKLHWIQVMMHQDKMLQRKRKKRRRRRSIMILMRELIMIQLNQKNSEMKNFRSNNSKNNWRGKDKSKNLWRQNNRL